MVKKTRTKGDTLHFLKTRIKESIISDMVTFTVEEWCGNSDSCIDNIQQVFSNKHVIVRSSAIGEDSISTAMAGYYLSIQDIDTTDRKEVSKAIQQVIDSYGHKNAGFMNCQVLIQEMVNNISMSGVVFTQDLNTGAPYYVINYDDESGRTDTITSGSDAPNKTVIILRNAVDCIKSPRISKVIKAVKEVESIMELDSLDIEFAETVDGHIYIFQVRPLSTQANWNRGISIEIEDAINRISSFVEIRQNPMPGIYGCRSLFGQMSDWNPVEILGTAPRPLALSLYRFLITDSTWRIARHNMGYADPSGTKLMVSLYGQPYIDVRLSFNNLIPKDLDKGIADKIVNAWLNHLTENPELHDKIEFEVAITAYTFDFMEKVSTIMPNVLTETETQLLRNSLLALTDSFVADKKAKISDQLLKLEELRTLRKRSLSHNNYCNLLTVNRLLTDCIEFGIIPFSILARHGFVAKSILLSLLREEVITEDEMNCLLKSIQTIASELIRDTDRVKEGDLLHEDFMMRYGHLRPGTYDILSLRYDQRPAFISKNIAKSSKNHDTVNFVFSNDQRCKIDDLLKHHGFSVGHDQLLNYIKSAIQGREYSKFIFSQSISDALEIIADWGADIGLSRDELSFLEIQDILDTEVKAEGRSLEHNMRNKSRYTEARYEVTHALRLPLLIVEPDDVKVFPLMRCRPNFITRNKIRALHVFLDGHNEYPPGLQGKIVLIEGADPGFDWIFSQGITGLITKFGGANSHMAIRCAELSIPAAIGCGEQIFERLLKAKEIELDCTKGHLEPVWGLC
ncbi:MAG: PEP/pyruvate-binding domain-containing protein [Candidatus Scalindua sp.]